MAIKTVHDLVTDLNVNHNSTLPVFIGVESKYGRVMGHITVSFDPTIGIILTSDAINEWEIIPKLGTTTPEIN